MSPTILLISGEYFDFSAPGASPFTIDDIAWALSNLCRFNGHCRQFYSIAQHSVLVSHLVPAALALQGLLHDGAEAFVGDITAPLKRLLPDYKSIEKRVEAAVLARFGLPDQLDPAVKRADLVALATERRDLMSHRGGIWTLLEGVEPDPERLFGMSPVSARDAFLRRFRELTE